MKSYTRGDRALRIVGAASFPVLVGTFTVSSPLAVLQADSDGISVDLRWRLLKRSYARHAGRHADEWSIEDACWTSSWEDLSVQLAGGNMVLTNGDKKNCRFGTSLRRLRPLIDEFERRGVPVRRVRSTIPWYFHPNRPPTD